MNIGLCPDPPTYIGLYPPLWATHPAAYPSSRSLMTPETAEDWLAGDLGCIICL